MLTLIILWLLFSLAIDGYREKYVDAKTRELGNTPLDRWPEDWADK